MGHGRHRQDLGRQEHQPGRSGGKACARACGKTTNPALILSASSGEQRMSRFLTFLCGALLAATPACSRSPRPNSAKWGRGPHLARRVRRNLATISFCMWNGGWLQHAQIPADRSSTGSFQDLQILKARTGSRSLSPTWRRRPTSGWTDEERKLRPVSMTHLSTPMGSRHGGLSPARADLDYLEHLKTLDDVAHAMGSIWLSTMSVFNIGIGVDDKHPDNYSVNLNPVRPGPARPATITCPTTPRL